MSLIKLRHFVSVFGMSHFVLDEKYGYAYYKLYMVKVYKCRVDTKTKLIEILILTVISVTLAYLYYKGGYGNLLIVLALTIWFPLFMFPIKYTLYNDFFTVRCGIIKEKYFYSNIKDVSVSGKPFFPCRNFAFSVKGVYVTFKKGIFGLFISPENREEFIEDLRRRIEK